MAPDQHWDEVAKMGAWQAKDDPTHCWIAVKIVNPFHQTRYPNVEKRKHEPMMIDVDVVVVHDHLNRRSLFHPLRLLLLLRHHPGCLSRLDQEPSCWMGKWSRTCGF